MYDRVVVEFPGLGIAQSELSKIAFTIGNVIEVRWYGIFITLGIMLAVAYATWRGKKNEGIIFDDVLDVALLTVLLGVLGARLYYVLTELDSFPTIGSAFAIWNGGLGIYGGIIGGCIGIVIACLVKKISWRKLFDMAAPGVMLAQAIGRWGNFFNGEAYGYRIGERTTYYFFLKEYTPASGKGTIFNFLRMGLWPSEYSMSRLVYVHPTFLYECVWNLIGFGLINIFYRKKKFDGQIALMYFAWYGFGRMFIEGFRTDSLYIFKGLGGSAGLRISQLIGLICFVGGTTLLTIFLLRAKNAEPLFDACTEELEEELESDEDLEDVEAIYGDEETEEVEETEELEEEVTEEIEDTENTENGNED